MQVANVNENKAVNVNGVLLAMPFVVMLQFMQVFNDKVFSLVTPNISNTFKVDAGMVSWVVTIASLIYGVGGALYSTLADRVSMRKLFIFGTIMFAGGSAFGFILQKTFMLVVVARAIQCIGAAVIPGCLVILIRRYVPSEKQPMYLGYSTAMYQISGGLGYAIGGYVTAYLSWQTAFLIPILTILVIPVFIKYLPDEVITSKTKIDFLGVILLALTAGILLFSVSKRNMQTGTVGLLLVGIFIIYSLKKKNSIIDLRIMKTKKYVPGMLSGISIYAAQSAFFFLFPFAMSNVYNLGAQNIGIMFIPANFSAFVSGMLSGKITQKLGKEKAFYLGCGIVVASLLMFATMIGRNIAFMWIALWLFGIGYTIIYPAFYSTYTGAMPEEKVGRCMALHNLIGSISYSLLVALTGVLISIKVLDISIIPVPAGLKNINIYSNMFAIFAISVCVGIFIYNRVYGSKVKVVSEK